MLIKLSHLENLPSAIIQRNPVCDPDVYGTLPDFLGQNEWQLPQTQHLYLLICYLRKIKQTNKDYAIFGSLAYIPVRARYMPMLPDSLGRK